MKPLVPRTLNYEMRLLHSIYFILTTIHKGFYGNRTIFANMKREQNSFKLGKVTKLRTPGIFGHRFANRGNPDEIRSHLIWTFTVCLVDYFLNMNQTRSLSDLT